MARSAASPPSSGTEPIPSEPTSQRTSQAAKRCPRCGARFPQSFRVCPHDATELVEAGEDEDPLLGQVLSDTYEVVRVLGEGGMGRVYEARHTRLVNKRFAVKMMHPELARQSEVVARFQREAEASSGLMHPNVVAVHDVNVTPEGHPYIVAELLQGEQLGDYLDRVERLAAPEATRLVRQICRALRAAHEGGIVHRDVKPENVFLATSPGSSEPVVKVLDFGISLVTESNAALTKTGMVMGTPDYMAPEQARGDRVDQRADIYATGAILYRAVTGSKPFEGRDEMAVLTAVLVEEPPRPSSLEAGITPALELVIQRAMAKDPAERYQSMSELERDLRELNDGAPAPEAIVEAPGGDRPSFLAEVMDAAKLSGAVRRARVARPLLVLLTVLSLGWLLAGLADAIVASLRWISPAAPVTRTEIWLSLLGASAALATPAVLWIKHVTRVVWGSTPRSMQCASRLGRTLFSGLAAYGGGAVAAHVVENLYLRGLRGAGGPAVNVLLFAAALATAAFTWLATRRRGVEGANRTLTAARPRSRLPE